MSKNRLALAAIVVITTAMAVVFSLLLLRTTTVAVAAYAVVFGMTMIFVEPFLGLVNYLIFLYLRPQEFIAGFVGLPVMLIIGSTTFGLMLLHMAIRRTSLGLRRVPQNYLVLWFFAAIALSHLSHLNMNETIASVQDFLSVVIMFFLIAVLIDSNRKLAFTLYLLLGMTLFLAVQGIYQRITGVGFAGQQLFQNRIVSIGIFSDPNDLALALLVVLPFAVLLGLSARTVFLKVLLFAVAITIAVTVFITESRGGILSLGLLVLILFARRYGWRRGAIAGVVMAFLIFVLGPSRMGTMSTEEASAAARVASWTVAIDLFVWYPIFGVGAHMFTSYHPKTAHNSLLLCASELGAFGLFAWLMLFLISFKNLRFIAKEAVEKGQPALALYADAVYLGIVAFFSGSMFLSRSYNEVLFVLFALSSAVTSLFVGQVPEKYVLIEKRDYLHNLVFMIGSILVLKAFLIWAW